MLLKLDVAEFERGYDGCMGCIGCIADVDGKAFGAIGVMVGIEDIGGAGDVDKGEAKAAELNEFEGTRVAPRPGAGRLVDDLAA